VDAELTKIPLPARRAIEAEILDKVYASAVERVGRDQALEILGAAIDASAFAAGRAFAAKAPGGEPSLAHFAKILDAWQIGGALGVAGIRQDADTLSFTVTRCGYAEMYARMGVARELHSVLSCRRDAAFAAGYSPRLALSRPETIAAGASGCTFAFRWT
jgi:hypothetical protein